MTKKIRGPIPTLISGSSGAPKIIIAERASKCSKCGDSILAKDMCVGLPRLGGAFKNVKRLCLICFKQIIEKTKADIEKLEEEIK